jgi:type I restriction-modification system DNA methylase subunit
MLRDVFRNRGLDVRHNGSAKRTAPGNKPDIDLNSESSHAIVEATKLRRVAQANNEATSVPAHLDQRAREYPHKRVFGIFVSPETADRTRQAFRRYNQDPLADGRWLLAVDFDCFNLLVEYLGSPSGQEVTIKRLFDVFQAAATRGSDDQVLELLNTELFKRPALQQEIDRIRQRRLTEKYARLDSVFTRLHKGLRTVVGLGPAEAFHELSKLIFLKMYEEQRVEREVNEGKLPENNFTKAYIEREKARQPPPRLHPIIELFDRIRDQYASEGLFDPTESIDINRDKVNGNYIDMVVAEIEDFQFIDPTVPIDIKGMIYEQFLGMSLKNTDLGQYFTPDPIIDFVVRLARLSRTDRVHDPACGTGRFLVAAMNYMLAACKTSAQKAAVKGRYLSGVEKSPYVAKIAKMNMFVHGDGRAGIIQGDSLEIDVLKGADADVILTNPPLGDVDFKNLIGDYEDNPAWYELFDVIPKTVKHKSGQTTTAVARNELKGGALFLNAFALKVKKGGRVVTIIDDAVLNTDEYGATREFLLKHFEVRAVFSLTDDAFKYASKTATKTSVLYMIRKDRTTVQTRPIFFGHAFKVGINPRGKATRNDLHDPGRPLDLLRAYLKAEARFDANPKARGGGVRERGKLADIGFESFSDLSFFTVPFTKIKGRLEFKFYDPTYKPVEHRLSSVDTVRLGEIVDWPDEKWPGEYGLTASGMEAGDYPFINIENLRPEGHIDLRGVRYLNKEDVLERNAEGKQFVKPKIVAHENDLLISRSRLPGIASVVGPDEDGAIFGSYIIRFRLSEGSRFLPRYVALFINSAFGQAQVHRLKSGSNGFNINSTQLGQLRIVRLGHDEQERVVQTVLAQQKTVARLGGIIHQYQSAAERMLLEACVGDVQDEQLSHLEDALASAVTEAEDVLQQLDEPSEDIEDIKRIGERFIIRPAFSGRLPNV